MRILSVVLLALLLLVGCTSDSGSSSSVDQTGEMEVIGYVNADTIYKINVERRIKDVTDSMRSSKNVFYQPTLDELIALNYVSLRREIRKVGLSHPGRKIDNEKKTLLAIQMANEKKDTIQTRIDEGADLWQISADFRLKEPQIVKQIKKGDITKWDNILWNTDEGSISEPFISDVDDRIYFFKVIEKHQEDSDEWVTVELVYFEIPLESAQRTLEDEVFETWDIDIKNGFYKAIKEYFYGEIDVDIPHRTYQVI